ncbi:hypothetical protein V3C99_010196, partial [Haemonchus contortus]
CIRVKDYRPTRAVVVQVERRAAEKDRWPWNSSPSPV